MKKTIITLLAFLLLFAAVQPLLAAEAITCWFPPDWKTKAPQAQEITKALSDGSGVSIRPRIARSYPEILAAFDSKDQNLVYVGSFVQAIIAARGIGTPLAQNVNGKEFYSGILILPQGADPGEILKQSPEKIAFALGASSGESSAKAATGGRAALGVANHGAAVGALKAGRASAAVVKNWWWEGNKNEYPGFVSYEIPGISLAKNPDNVLTASRAVPEGTRKKIREAAILSSSAFGSGASMRLFDEGQLLFSIDLMKKGKIDPKTYSW